MFEVYLAWTALLRVLLHTCASLLLALNRLKTFKNFGFSFTSQKLCLNKSSCLFLSKILKHAKMTKVAVFVGVACMFGDGTDVGCGVGTADLLIAFQSWSHHNPSDLSAQELVPPTPPNLYPHPLPCLFQPSTPTYHVDKKALSSVFLLFLFHHLWPPPFFTKLRTQPLK